MDEEDWLSARFEQHRSHLRSVAYRMLGSVSDADDALQEAWLRIRDQDPESVQNMEAWLTTVVVAYASTCFAPDGYDATRPGTCMCPTPSWCSRAQQTPSRRS